MVTEGPELHSLVFAAADKIVLTVSHGQVSDGSFVAWCVWGEVRDG